MNDLLVIEVGMFYFDGETCETMNSVYERKEKTCDSTAAKLVYIQKGFEPSKLTLTILEQLFTAN